MIFTIQKFFVHEQNLLTLHITEMYFLYRRISSENMTLREDQDRKTREIADLSDVGKRREEELQRMDQELKRIGQELANANAAKVLYAKTYFGAGIV